MEEDRSLVSVELGRYFRGLLRIWFFRYCCRGGKWEGRLGVRGFFGLF